MGDGRVLQVRVDVLDDRVLPVQLVHRDRTRLGLGDGRENVWKRHTSTPPQAGGAPRVPCPADFFLSAFTSGIRRTTSRPGT